MENTTNLSFFSLFAESEKIFILIYQFNDANNYLQRKEVYLLSRCQITEEKYIFEDILIYKI